MSPAKLRLLSASSIVLTAVAAGQAKAEEGGQIFYPAGSQAAFDGPEKIFTGKVRVQPVFPENDTAHYSGAFVTFEPGARTAWHLHPGGQHIVVTEGIGRTGTWDGKVVEVKAGDALWCPPGIKHWHGAAPHTAMTHFVVTGSLDGKNVEWQEKVTDDQYLGR